MHLVLAAVGQQMPVGKPESGRDQSAAQLIGEETLQQHVAAPALGRAVEPTPKRVDTGRRAKAKHPAELLVAHVLELFERADVAHRHQRKHQEQTPTVAEQREEPLQPTPLAEQHQQDGKHPGVAARLPVMIAGKGALAQRRCRRRSGQRRTEGLLYGRLLQHVQRRIRCVIPGQCDLLGSAFARTLRAAQRLQFACLGAGAALVDVQVAL